MSWTITVLCENTVPKPGLIGEHGFAALVETPQETLLFDTGQGMGLVHNALRLKKDLAGASRLVLSHGHFDHTGGLLAFLGVHGACRIVAHPDVFSERFWWLPAGVEEKPLSIGMPWPEAYLTSRGAQFEWHEGFSEIAPGVFFTGEVPRRTDFEKGDSRMTVRRDGDWALDPFRDDASLILKTPRGLVVVLGCAHAGLLNILQYATEKTGESRIHALVGGTHLGFYSAEHLERNIEVLKGYGVEKIAVSHCTGQGPAARLAEAFGPRFAFGCVGFTLTVEM